MKIMEGLEKAISIVKNRQMQNIPEIAEK